MTSSHPTPRPMTPGTSTSYYLGRPVALWQTALHRRPAELADQVASGDAVAGQQTSVRVGVR